MVIPPVIVRRCKSPSTRSPEPLLPYFCQNAEIREVSPELNASSHCLKTRKATVSEGGAAGSSGAQKHKQSRIKARFNMVSVYVIQTIFVEWIMGICDI